MRIQWQIEPGMRCDLVTYSAQNLSGKRGQIRIFPSGSRKGEVLTENVRSMVVRAPIGTRLVLVSVPGPQWEEGAWRCVRLLDGDTMPSERGGGLPGVRIPDLDLLDDHDAKRTNADVETSYPNVARFSDGSGWTFGRTGGLKGRVVEIRVERDTGRSEARLVAAEKVARGMLAEVAARSPDQLLPLVDVAAASLLEALEADRVIDATARVEALRTFAESLT